jgi:hypothetical protein
LRWLVAGWKGPAKIEGETSEWEVGAGSWEVSTAGITKEEVGARGRKGEGEVIGGPGEGGEEVGWDESSPSTTGEVDTAISREEGEAVECVEVGSCKKVMEGGPLKGSSHAL